MTLNHLSSELGFDGITDLINGQGNGVRSNSEDKITVTVGQMLQGYG